MNTLFTSLGAPMLAWLADYYFIATLLLLTVLVGRQFVRQPAHRILIAWTAMLELAVLAVVCALPFWPKISFVVASPPQAVAVAEPPAVVEQPIAPMPFMPPMAGRNVADSISVKPSTPEVELVESTATPEPRMTWSEMAIAAYLTGAALVALWLCWGAAATTWLCWRAKPAADRLKAELSDIVRNKRREPRLLVSEQIANAVALGVLRPTIVLPDAMVQTSPPQTLRAVLLHEWAHIRHRDLWLLALGRFLLAVLFTHPLFWLLRRAIRGDQELLADAVAAGDNPHDYAEELVRLVRIAGDISPRSLSAAVGIWEGPSSFSRRIAMLLDETFRVHPTGSRRWRLKALAAMTVVGLICSLVTLQPAPSPGEQEQSAAKENQAPAEKSPWTATLPNGVTIELIGLAPNPSDGRAWWRPDGSPLPERPYINKDSPLGKSRNRAVEVAYRVVRPDSEPGAHSCSIPDNLGMGSLTCRDAEGQCIGDGLHATPVFFPHEQKTMSIRLGAVAGPWELAAKMGPTGGKSERADLPVAEDFKAIKKDGQFVVEGIMGQTWGLAQDDRLIVVGDDGVEHRFDLEKTQDVPNKPVRHCTFRDRHAKNRDYPPLTAIKQMRLEYRRYQFVEFKNISLWPGEKTKVQTIVVPDTAQNDSNKSSELKSQHTVRVVGTCVDANNRPIAGAEVCLYERIPAATYALLEQRKTDAAGKFEFSDLRLTVPESDDDLRSFFVQARAEGKARESDGFTSAMIREDVWRCKLILQDAMTITGRITDTNGKSVAGALISKVYGPLAGSTDPNCLATTDADGFYRATDAPKIGPKFREGLLYVRHPGFLKNAVAFRENRDKIDFVLTPASIIEGRVIDAVTGKPAANVFVGGSMIFPDGHEPRDRGLANPYADATITDAEGRYRLPAMAGKHYLRALQTQKGRTACPIEAFEIKEGERRTAPDLRLVEGGLIEASVVDAETGQPPKYRHGGEVVLYGPSCPLGMATHTFEYRPDGVIRIRAVPGMNYVAFEDRARKEQHLERVEAVKDSSFDSKGRIPVEVVEGQTAKVKFKVRLKATPTDDDGKDINGVQLRIRSHKTSWSATEIPTLHAELRNSETGSPVTVQWGMSQLQLEVDGKWFKGPFFLPGPFEVCEPGTVLKNLVTVSPVWIEARKEELEWRGGTLLPTSANDTKKVIELRPGTHVVRVGCVVEDRNDYAGFRVVSNAVKVVIEPPADSQPVNWPASPEVAKAIVVDLTEASLTHLNPNAKIIDDMLALAGRVQKQSTGTPLQDPSQTLVDALTAYRKAIRDKVSPAAEKEKREAINKAIIAMTRLMAGLPQDSPPSKLPAK